MMKGSHHHSFTIAGNQKLTMDLLSLPRHHPKEVKSKRTFVRTSADVVSFSDEFVKQTITTQQSNAAAPAFLRLDAVPLPFHAPAVA
jgi:hypothetical protein